MVISIKDSFKFIGVSIVCFCAVFVCTFFLNYYIDILPLENTVNEEILPLYKAQLATAKMTTGITGGFLSVIAAIMLVFYIKLYIDSHHYSIGLLKAMGFSNLKIATNFLIFGFSILLGCGLGFGIGWAFIPLIYKGLTIDGLDPISPKFHISLLFLLVFLPTIIFSLIAFVQAFIKLKKPALAIMRGESGNQKKVKPCKKNKNRPFLTEMCLSSLKSKKALAFFVTFSAFCFSAMVQMGLSMEDLVGGTMGLLILIIGIVLAVVSMLMAMTSLVKHHSKNIAVMKSLGFNKKECFISIFLPYIPLAILGFIIGTAYQYGLLSLMINLIFKNVENVPAYSFNVPVLFITLALFLLSYTATFAYYLFKANKVSIKEIMLED